MCVAYVFNQTFFVALTSNRMAEETAEIRVDKIIVRLHPEACFLSNWWVRTKNPAPSLFTICGSEKQPVPPWSYSRIDKEIHPKKDDIE